MQKLLYSAQFEIKRLNKENKVLTKHLETQPELFIHNQDCSHSIQHSNSISQTHDIDDQSYSPFGMRF